MATNDVLKALLENELLTDDVKKSIAGAFATIVDEQKTLAEEAAIAEAGDALNEALAEAREKMEGDVRIELATKFVSERNELIKSLDESVTEMLAAEVAELKEDISDFRDLEVEMIAKLEDEKDALAEQFASEKKVFVTEIDKFVESRITDEMQELNEDITEIKKNTAGMQLFEAFVATYEDSFADKDEHIKSVKAKLEEMANEKEAAEARATALEEQVSDLTRSKALEETLAPLSGKRKAVMASILEGFSPDKFGVVYNKMIPRVLNSVPAGSVVLESASSTSDPETVEIMDGDSRLDESDAVIEDEAVLTESTNAASELSMIRKLAGITK